MSIVYVKNRNGSVYAYESEAKWIPELKQSRPVRTYLGRVDPVTHDIIPSSGRKGRRKKEDDPISDAQMANGDYKTLYEESLKKNRKLEEDLKDANHTVALLTRHLSETQKQLETVEKIVKKTLSDMTDTVYHDDR